VEACKSGVPWAPIHFINQIKWPCLLDATQCSPVDCTLHSGGNAASILKAESRTLKMETAHLSKTSVMIYQTTQSHSQGHENLRSHIVDTLPSLMYYYCNKEMHCVHHAEAFLSMEDSKWNGIAWSLCFFLQTLQNFQIEPTILSHLCPANVIFNFTKGDPSPLTTVEPWQKKHSLQWELHYSMKEHKHSQFLNVMHTESFCIIQRHFPAFSSQIIPSHP
jgi:hypothetical protein